MMPAIMFRSAGSDETFTTVGGAPSAARRSAASTATATVPPIAKTATSVPSRTTCGAPKRNRYPVWCTSGCGCRHSRR